MQRAEQPISARRKILDGWSSPFCDDDLIFQQSSQKKARLVVNVKGVWHRTASTHNLYNFFLC